MKYFDLNIDTETFEIYQKVTNLMRVKPFECVQENNKVIWQQDVKDKYKLWTYKVVNNEEIEHFDFINNFLDLLEPNIQELQLLGIYKENILIWLFYEYDQQCSLSFNSQEMKRLGESGIALNIDCIRKNKE